VCKIYIYNQFDRRKGSANSAIILNEGVTTMAIDMNLIATLLGQGFSHEQIATMIAGENKELVKPKKKKKEVVEKKRDGMKYVTPFKMKEVVDIYNALESNRDRLYVIISVHTAYRVSDIVQLKFKDVRKQSIVLIEGKTKNKRIVEVHDRIKEELEKFANCDDNDYCFPSRQGNGHITRQTAHNIVVNAAEKIGLISRTEAKNERRQGNIDSELRYGTHSLRKAFGRFLWENGYDITIIMEHYGHSTPNITRTYLGIDQEDKNKVTRLINYGV
jgi:integrase